MNPHPLPSTVLEEAVRQLSRLPGVGSRSALRYALHLQHCTEAEVRDFAEAVLRLKTHLHECRYCHTISDTTATVCDSFDWYEHTGMTSSQVVNHSFTNFDGCDSVVTLHLTINYSSASDSTIIIPSNALPLEFAGQSLEAYGEYDIVVANAAGCDSTIHLTLNQYLSLDDVDESTVLAPLTVYPNPTTGQVRIESDPIVQVEVFNLTGSRVARFENTYTLNLSHLPAGSYLLRITLPNALILRKVEKSN